MEEEILEEFGFSKNEAKVYLALLYLGSSTAGDISKKSKVHRTNVYDALERMIEKGLVAFVDKEKTKYFEATDPENLLNILKEKELRLQHIMPQLVLSRKLAEKKGKVCIYEGISAVKAILNNFLLKNSEILVYGIPKEALSLLQFFIIDYHKRRIKKKIKMRHIYNADAQERIKYLNSLEYTAARYLPKEYNAPVSTNICGDEVVLILWPKPITAMQIIDQAIADSYRKYFELLWRLARC